MVWPWAGPVIRVRRISMSRVPCTISEFVGARSPMPSPLECLGESLHHSIVYGKDFFLERGLPLAMPSAAGSKFSHYPAQRCRTLGQCFAEGISRYGYDDAG